MVLVVKNPPATAGDIRDLGSVPGWKRFLGKKMATHSSILASEISWTEEPGKLHTRRYMWDLPGPRDGTHASCIGRQILNY